MTEYIIRAALHEETNEGWIWANGFPSRTIVRTSNPASDSAVFCQIRKLDDNFRKLYNDDPKKQRIPLIKADTIVMSQWFRDGLGIKATNKDNKTGLVALKIVSYEHCWRFWGSVRATAHHPEIVVRIGISLGVLGVILGTIALVPTLLDIAAIPKPCQWPIVLVVAFISILFGYLACRRPKLVQ